MNAVSVGQVYLLQDDKFDDYSYVRITKIANPIRGMYGPDRTREEEYLLTYDIISMDPNRTIIRNILRDVVWDLELFFKDDPLPTLITDQQTINFVNMVLV